MSSPSASACGYCRVDSDTRVGDQCPSCGRNKAPEWWKICVPVTVPSRPECAGDDRSRSGLLPRLRRHVPAIILSTIYLVGFSSTALLAVTTVAA